MIIQRVARSSLLVLLGAAFASCGGGDGEPVRTTPEQIRGVWTTDDAAYADRRLEIMEEAVLFYTEEHAFDPYVIQDMRTIPEDKNTLYKINHNN